LLGEGLISAWFTFAFLLLLGDQFLFVWTIQTNFQIEIIRYLLFEKVTMKTIIKAILALIFFALVDC
jgi:hypothetical protein